MEISKPTLLIDKDKCIQNIAFMAAKAKHFKLGFRPHFKTHQSAVIGELFRKFGVETITVSSVTMAKYFAENGWNDITIAFPINIREIDEINMLAQRIKLNLLVDNLVTLEFLENNLQSRTDIFIKIDTAYHRAGILWDNTEEIDSLINFLTESKKLIFKGILTHAGHSYNAKSIEEIKTIHQDTMFKMASVKLKYYNRFPSMIVSIGDTPCCSVCEDFDGIDEIRPGNFVFYDVMQYNMGSCNFDEIAIAVACPVVSTNPSRKELIIYGGSVHFSKESMIDKNKRKIYGLPVQLTGSGWGKPIPDSYVTALSQDHGIIKTNFDFVKTTKPGNIIGILPVHSCLTAHQLQNFHDLNGDVIATMNG